MIEPAAILTARLLADCPGVRVLATSREPLRIGGESLYVVAPLPVPPAVDPAVGLVGNARVPTLDGGRPDLHRRRCGCSPTGPPPCPPASALRRTRPGRGADLPALDGMPLAIELAAAGPAR